MAEQAGEDWAEEGGMHIFKVVPFCPIAKSSSEKSLFKVVREVGKRMMEKAYMGTPHAASSALSNEE